MRLLIGIGVTAVLAIVSYLLIAFTKWELCPANWEVPNRATLSILVLVSVFLGWYVYKIKEYNSDLQLGDKKIRISRHMKTSRISQGIILNVSLLFF
jgi:membrane protein implicated in regulation of membrane protease activity